MYNITNTYNYKHSDKKRSKVRNGDLRLEQTKSEDKTREQYTVELQFDTNYFDHLSVFQWVRIAHRLWLICSCSVMKETLRRLFLKKSNLKLWKLSARRLDIWTIY